MLEVSNLTVQRGKAEILSDVSFSVPQGEVVALVGANGAGKTTLLQTLSGMLPAATGTIRFRAQDVDVELGGRRPHEVARLGIAHVPEGRGLFPDLTVRENLTLASSFGDARSRREETLEYVIGLFPILGERLRQQADTLSGGEQQMLAIARGLMGRPKLLVLDEPSIGLAPIMVDRVYDAVSQLRENDITMLIAEQTVSHSLKLCDRAYVIRNGRFVASAEGSSMLEGSDMKETFFGL